MDEKLKDEFINTFLRLRKTKSRFLANRDISWGALMLLEKLNTDGNVNGICEILQITKPAVTYMLNSFEEEGYLTRSIDPKDRRRIEIKLTGKGKRLIKIHRNIYGSFFNEVLTRFGDSNIKDFIRISNRFADVIDEVTQEWENE